MEQIETYKRRNVGKSGAITPLLVPSFSSTAFARASDIRYAMDALRPQIATCSLVSAFDIGRNNIDAEIGYSDFVILDSGNYEKRVIQGLGVPVEWSLEDHDAAIDKIVPLTELAVVNYDTPGPLSEQVSSAKAFFDKHPQFSTDFLCKPNSPDASYLDFDNIENALGLIQDFDIIGVTEKELGGSLMERCRHLLRLRRSLDTSGRGNPIHVFGCFDPLSVVLMFLCGGDIFDGLTWARYSMKDGVLVYPGGAALDHDWSLSDGLIQRAMASNNINQMTELMFRLRTFVEDHDYSGLGLPADKLQLLNSIITEAASG